MCPYVVSLLTDKSPKAELERERRAAGTVFQGTSNR